MVRGLRVCWVRVWDRGLGFSAGRCEIGSRSHTDFARDYSSHYMALQGYRIMNIIPKTGALPSTGIYGKSTTLVEVLVGDHFHEGNFEKNPHAFGTAVTHYQSLTCASHTNPRDMGSLQWEYGGVILGIMHFIILRDPPITRPVCTKQDNLSNC